MRHSDNTNENTASFSPSDDDLIGYLLGSSSAALRTEIESWLAADECHGDRLCQFASIMLAVSETPLLANVVDKTNQPNRKLVVSDRSARRSQMRVVIGLLSLAATISIIVFSIRGFHSDGLSDGRVAMAWADSLATGLNSESIASTPDWLLENGLTNDASDDLASDDVAGDLGESELAAEDLADGETLIGFSSGEPPEWMLAAFADMQSNGTIDENSEVQP